MTVFDDCARNLDAINPTIIPVAAEIYYTWKITCLMFWFESANPLAQVSRVSELKGLIRDGLAATTNANNQYIGTYEGAALGRNIAAIYAFPGGRQIGLYKPEEALKLSSAALAAGLNSPDGAFPVSLSGKDYYENYWAVGNALRELGKKSEALAKIMAGINSIETRLEDDDLPARREYETIFQLQRLRDLLARTNSDN